MPNSDDFCPFECLGVLENGNVTTAANQLLKKSRTCPELVAARALTLAQHDLRMNGNLKLSTTLARLLYSKWVNGN